MQVDTLVLRFRCPSRTTIPDDGDPRGEARVVLSVAAHNVHLQVAAYDLQFSDTSLTRVLRRVKDTFVARGGKRLKKIRRKDPVHACIVTDRYGEFHVQPFDPGVPSCGGAFTSFKRVVSRNDGSGWFGPLPVNAMLRAGSRRPTSPSLNSPLQVRPTLACCLSVLQQAGVEHQPMA